ncbi:MAG TPA: PAS domain S-box protein, partial [Candidatus Binatia bacterium]
MSLGLISSSAILVHLSGGYIELHFHFFVMLVFLALYQDWAPYLLAIAYVAIHHGIVGTLWPQEVYNHPAALSAPWTWGGIHAFFILFQFVGSIVFWRFNESATARSQLILDSVGDGIYGVDRAGRIIFANPVAAQTFGREVKDFIGKPIEKLLIQNGGNGNNGGMKQSILAGLREPSSQREGHALWRRADGSQFSAEYSCSPIIERGEWTGTVVSFRDVSARELAAETLRRSQKQYHDLIQSIDGIVWEADAETFRFTFVSDDAERILGFPARTWIDEPHFWSDHIHPADREWAVRFCSKATEEKRPHRFEYRMTAADGRVVWLGDIVSVVIENGKAVKLRGVMIDITQRCEAEERARRNHDRIRTLHEITAAASSSLELNIVLESLMEKIVALLPYAAVQIWLRNVDTGKLERRTCLNIDRDEWLRRELKELPLLIRIAAESKIFVVSDNVQADPRTLDREFYRKQGVVAYLGIPFVVKEEVLGVLVLLTRKTHSFASEEIELLTAMASQVAMAINKSQLYAQIKSQADELEKANKEICDFTAMIAHDLRSPLNNVMGVSELMTDSAFGPVTDEQKKWLGKVVETVRQLVALVNNFLDVSKLEAG